MGKRFHHKVIPPCLLILGKDMVSTKRKIRMGSSVTSANINEVLQMKTTLYFDKKKNRFLNKIVIPPQLNQFAYLTFSAGKNTNPAGPGLKINPRWTYSSFTCVLPQQRN
jgi:hypothetical protein